jgi:GNAT superfamily N-acetyltransferase
MEVCPKTGADAAWIGEVLARYWGGPLIVAGAGSIIDASRLPALIAGDHQGLATYAIAADGAGAELVTLNALARGQGIGTALVEALVKILAADGVAELRVGMTNDNLDALRFYQRRDFRLMAVWPGAVDEARKLKPAIPLIGHYGIPIRDRLDLVRAIAPN